MAGRDDRDPRLPEAAIVVAYGPRAVTRAAVRRVKSIVSGRPVITVPGIADRSDGGEKGFVAAVADCPDGPVLVVHDDVAVDKVGVARLTAALGAGVTMAVPYTNDLEIDHHHGVLPAVNQAGPAVAAAQTDPIARSVPPSSVAKVRPACLVAERRRLLDLLPRRLHDPLTVLTDVASGLVAVPGAVAAHDNSCVQRIRGFRNRGQGPLLVATMIVRDEASNITPCLESVGVCTDRLHVCDTGSTDDTVALAEAAGAQVIHRPWRDDFGWARNESLGPCRDATWVLWVDADERLIVPDVELLRGYLAAYAGEMDALEIEIANRSDSSTDDATTRFLAPRLLRADRCEFVGALHEQPRLIGASDNRMRKAKCGLLSLDHFGYTAEMVDARAKKERNVEVARAAYEADPDHKTALDYARSLTLAGIEPERAVELLTEASEGLEDDDLGPRVFVHGFTARLLLNELHRPAAAREHALQGLRLIPADDVCLIVYAHSCVQLGLDSELIESANENEAVASLAPLTVVDSARAGYYRAVAEAHVRAALVSEAWYWMARCLSVDVTPDYETLVVAVELAHALGGDLVARLMELVRVLGTDERVDQLVAVVAESSPIELTARVASSIAAEDLGGEGVVSTGLLALAMSAELELADSLLRRSHLLPPELASRLADRLAARGLHELSRRLVPAR